MRKRERILLCCAALTACSICESASGQVCTITPATLCQSGPGYLTRHITIEDSGIGGVDVVRDFDVHCPSGSPTGAIPLVLLLHGGHGLPSGLEQDVLPNLYSDNAQATDLGKFFLVLPAAWDYNSNPNILDTQWANHSDDLAQDPPDRVDDVKFIDDLLDCLISQYNGTGPAWTIDTGKIYATGMSDGAGMVNRLAVDITDRFAAVASVSGRLSYVYDESYHSG